MVQRQELSVKLNEFNLIFLAKLNKCTTNDWVNNKLSSLKKGLGGDLTKYKEIVKEKI